MKIGLVRHFRVKRGYPSKQWLTKEELMTWADEYEVSDIEESPIDLGGIEWSQCFSSDISRAVKTAAKFHEGPIIQREELREVKMYPFFNRNIKLPFMGWAILGRAGWLLSHKSQLESKEAVQQRVQKVIDDILVKGGENVLIVSHGAVMVVMRKELIKRGFMGPKLNTPKNAKLYVFEK